MNEFSGSVLSRQHNYNAVQVDFLAQYQGIVNKKLDARRVDNYADDALGDLIDLVKKALETSDADESFDRQTQERQALQDVGFEPEVIEITLDHIARVADSIRSLDDLIENKTTFTDNVIVPPDQIETTITHGDGSFEWSKETIPKLKTFLLLLHEQFNVDLESGDVSILSGALHSSMMRKQSYKLVDIKSLERTVLICDEHGNATFVLNRANCNEYGIQIDDLAGFTKAEIKWLLGEDPGLGMQINYSDKYVENLIVALSGEMDRQEVEAKENPTASLLQPKTKQAPEGYLSVKGMAREYKVSPKTIKSVVDLHEDEIGKVMAARFGAISKANAYSPYQQELIKSYLNEKNLLAKTPDEGYVSAKGMSKQLGIDAQAIYDTIRAFQSELGDIVQARFGVRVTNAYSPRQQEIIKSHLEKRGVLVEEPRDGYTNIHDMAQSFGVSGQAVKSAIQHIGDSLGSVMTSKFGPVVTSSFSPEQQEMIRLNLEDRGLLALSPDDGYLSAKGVADSIGLSAEIVRRAIKQVNDHLGDVNKAKFRSIIANAYSPEQQEIIIDYIKKNSKVKLIGRQAAYRADASK